MQQYRQRYLRASKLLLHQLLPVLLQQDQRVLHQQVPLRFKEQALQAHKT
jgi:hypothetical protein